MKEAVDAEQIRDWKMWLPAAFARPLAARMATWCLWGAFLGLVGWCLYDFDVTPRRLWLGLTRMGQVTSFMFPPKVWTSWEEFRPILVGLGQTVAMAFIGTLLAVVCAFPLSFLGARTINRITPLRLLSRRGFDVLRAFESLILALIFIRAFGLGPLAGIMAIAVSDTGVLAKLFSEALENISHKPVEAITATGGTRAQVVRFAVLPQVLPVFASITLYTLESNVRSSTILGIVGAGGIGLILSDLITAYRWGEVWSVIFLIVAMVYFIDWLSGRIRRALGGA